MPLALLGLPAEPTAALNRLGVTTVGAFLDLPSGGLVRRFGEGLARLRRALLGDDPLPLQPHAPAPSYDVTLSVEPPDADASRLLFLVRSALPPLLARLAAAGQALAALGVSLSGAKRAGSKATARRVTPATPTLDDRLLSDLVRLSLDSLRLAEPVDTIVLRPETVPATTEQLALFSGRGRQDAEAVSRAIARIRAAYGADSVVRARLRESHVPEDAWSWEPLTGLPPPSPEHTGRAPPPLRPTVVRAVLPRPERLARRAGERRRLAGPYLVEQGWWEDPVRRAYHFVETASGEVLWVYHDLARDQWFVHGEV